MGGIRALSLLITPVKMSEDDVSRLVMESDPSRATKMIGYRI